MFLSLKSIIISWTLCHLKCSVTCEGNTCNMVLCRVAIQFSNFKEIFFIFLNFFNKRSESPNYYFFLIWYLKDPRIKVVIDSLKGIINYQIIKLSNLTSVCWMVSSSVGNLHLHTSIGKLIFNYLKEFLCDGPSRPSSNTVVSCLKGTVRQFHKISPLESLTRNFNPLLNSGQKYYKKFS